MSQTYAFIAESGFLLQICGKLLLLYLFPGSKRVIKLFNWLICKLICDNTMQRAIQKMLLGQGLGIFAI